MRSPLLPCLFAALVGVLALSPADAQVNRRDRQDPELIIESGGRTGACDYLTFTADGKQLIAAGDDKVVRVWDLMKGKLQPAARPVLRWSVWREQRGAIYALALSPDPLNEKIAIGGLGALSSTVTILDRATGKILHTVTPLKKGENFYAVMAVDFAPSGKRVAFGTGDGSVWVWDFETSTPPRRCGKHEPKAHHESLNLMRLVRFLGGDDTLLSVAEDGTVSRWNVGGNQPRRTELPTLAGEELSFFHVALSPDKKWLAAASKGPHVVLRSVDGRQTRDIPLEEGQFPRSVVFDPRSNRLAVGVGSLVKGSDFHVEADDVIRFYKLGGEKPQPTKVLPHTYRAEFLAFHPTEDYLAIAGGDNQEVTLWDLHQPKEPVSVMQGAGRCLWGVAVSEDGDQVAFQDRRDATSSDPNRRGTGGWHAFDLAQRKWGEAADFKPVEQLTTADGWTIKPHPTDPKQWYAVSPNKKPFLLPRFERQENLPRCYTFIKATDKTPTRVAVGHYWGLSLYELTERGGARRTRVCAGHQGEVMALAVSADQSWLVSASNDQTLAAWNIGDTFPSQPILGAKFALKRFAGERDRLLVEKVDVGSPAWEAGLLENDEVVLFGFAAKDVPGGKAAWLARLKDPVPGVEHYFGVRRGGHPLTAADRSRFGLLGGCAADWIEGQTVAMITTARHRPLWRFFPTRDGEWVLWMWRNSFYDCSTNGDSYIGWHVNSPDPAGMPTFYRAEQFRTQLARRDVIDVLVADRDVAKALRVVNKSNPMPLSFDRFEPPAVTLKLGATTVAGQDVPVTVRATAVGSNPDYQPVRAELWVNDYRVYQWENLEVWAKEGNQYSLTATVPNAKLRAGRNTVTFQTYNRLGGRAEIASAIHCTRPPPAKPRLWGLAVGVDDYKNVKVPAGRRDKLQDLTGASNDAKEFGERWRQLGQMYAEEPKLFVHLDKDANRADVLAALATLAAKVGPDDNCVILLAGHGLFLKPETKEGEAPRSTFVFCGPDFDLSRPLETGIASEVLYSRLAAIAGHKVVILDACHSGEAAANPVRGLVPGGQGPVIMAACDRNQFSFEFPKEDKDKRRHGLFTYAILQALGDKFADADVNRNGELDAAEIYRYTRQAMPALLKEIDQKEHAQVPIMFTPAGPLVPLARAKEK